MICPICNSKLVEKTSLMGGHVTWSCGSHDNEHYSRLYVNANGKMHFENESFIYLIPPNRFVIQKIYCWNDDFFWSVRHEFNYSSGGMNVYATKHSFNHLTKNEFETKFNEFNPKDPSPIIDRFEMLEVFA